MSIWNLEYKTKERRFKTERQEVVLYQLRLDVTYTYYVVCLLHGYISLEL